MPAFADPRIDAFFAGAPHAVVGASTNRDKYGNKVLRCYLQHGRPVFAINPRADAIEGVPCFADVASLPEPVHGLSLVTPPKVTEAVVEAALGVGVRRFWMQPGAESDDATRRAEAEGAVVIPGDACVLVALGYNNRWTPESAKA